MSYSQYKKINFDREKWNQFEPSELFMIKQETLNRSRDFMNMKANKEKNNLKRVSVVHNNRATRPWQKNRCDSNRTCSRCATCTPSCPAPRTTSTRNRNR